MDKLHPTTVPFYFYPLILVLSALCAVDDTNCWRGGGWAWAGWAWGEREGEEDYQVWGNSCRIFLFLAQEMLPDLHFTAAKTIHVYEMDSLACLPCLPCVLTATYSHPSYTLATRYRWCCASLGARLGQGYARARPG